MGVLFAFNVCRKLFVKAFFICFGEVEEEFFRLFAASMELLDLEFDIPVELGDVMANRGDIFVDGV